MAIQGILVDVDYCTGCEACVLACQQEHGYSEKEFGIKITKLGPLHIDEANKVFHPPVHAVVRPVRRALRQGQETHVRSALPGTMPRLGPD